MKNLFLVILLFSVSAVSNPISAQNASINVITRNSGEVKENNIVFFEVTVNNTDPSAITGIYKLKVQVSIADTSLVAIQATGHDLPTGWQIINHTGNVIALSNGKDIIAPNDARTLLIALKGKKVGGPVTISGQLSFSNGIAPGIEPGSSERDNPADNFSTSTCTVIH